MSIPAEPTVAAAVVRDPATTTEILAELAASPLAFLREGVAVHPHVTANILDSLVQETLDPEIDLGLALARKIAGNPRTRSSTLANILSLLAPDQVDGARRENLAFEELAAVILTNRNCPEKEAALFLKRVSLPRELKTRIARETANRKILETLAVDDSETVRSAAALNLKASDAIQ